MVKVVVLFFGKARELSGVKEAEFSFPEVLGRGEILDRVSEKFDLCGIRKNVILAHNSAYLPEEVTVLLKEGDELAVIPPLSGG